ncbi:MAG: adenylate/guanylate cyclase domain-containing protein [Acidobacteriota bacterium]|nr:adenylate/guanylate cyclase domain-containing protein [Acidobacteriota bacterium]
MKVGALCAALVAAIFLAWPDFFGGEWWLFDFYSRHLAASRPADSRIVLVTVDDGSIRTLAEFYGRPPYSREVWALVVEELKRDGARVIAFDLLFSEENSNAPEGDRAFARSLEGAPVILGAHPSAKPHPMFRAAGAGSIELRRETTNVHFYRLAEKNLPSLALAAARRIRPNIDAPVNEDGDFLLRWNGAKKKPNDLSYAHVDLHKVILAALARQDNSIDANTLAQFAQQFRGKIVVIGYIAAGLVDLRANPLSPVAPGMELHANAIDNLINSDFNRVPNKWLLAPLLLLLGSAFGAGIGRTRSQLVSGIAATLAIAATVAIGYAALVAGYALPAFTACIALALTYIVITVVKFVAEQQQTALLKMTFGRYVSPQILDHILDHPEKVQLGGERRDLTILFSDIRGFTSISEASEPEEVVDMLNEYLTKMVDILLAHGGTLDKFIGDAVMGFWNAPAADPDHARHAVACAVEMIDATAQLRERWEREGKAAIRIGIGVNTGEAVAGNIGSERVFGYTVIGDAVNLASRLESKNKDYGTEIIVSESTLARMGDGFTTVYLDEVKVKGKERAVKIYEVKGQT